MGKDIRKSYRRYLRLQKNFTENTIDAYLRDLDKLLRWLQSTGVEAVAAKYGIDAKKVEQIARLYVTHPGVTVDGIMTKMGL